MDGGREEEIDGEMEGLREGGRRGKISMEIENWLSQCLVKQTPAPPDPVSLPLPPLSLPLTQNLSLPLLPSPSLATYLFFLPSFSHSLPPTLRISSPLSSLPLPLPLLTSLPLPRPLLLPSLYSSSYLLIPTFLFSLPISPSSFILLYSSFSLSPFLSLCLSLPISHYPSIPPFLLLSPFPPLLPPSCTLYSPCFPLSLPN